MLKRKVSGGNGGIGYELIKVSRAFHRVDYRSAVTHPAWQALLPRNAKVYMASRSEQRAEAAIAKLKSETGKEAIFLSWICPP